MPTIATIESFRFFFMQEMAMSHHMCILKEKTRSLLGLIPKITPSGWFNRREIAIAKIIEENFRFLRSWHEYFGD